MLWTLTTFFALLIKFSTCSKQKSIFLSDLRQRAAAGTHVRQLMPENEGAVAEASEAIVL